MIPQANLNSKDITVEVTRGQLVSDKSNWKVCSSQLLDGTYRMWHMKAMFDGKEYVATFAVPADAIYFRDLMGIWTEFLSNPGYWRTYYWSPEFIREGSSFWEPINNWRVIYNFGGSNNVKGFGFRLTSYRGLPAIEVSNDEKDYYLKAGEALSLASGASITGTPLPGKK